MHGRPEIERVGGVSSHIEWDIVLSSPVTVVVVDRHSRAVDGQLLKVRSTMSVQLRVQVRVDAPLQERIFCEIDPAYNVTRLELEKG